ncbi:hypothetical protein [Panacagrimonas sp.]|uniref:hypothetical protein n=1 Tax=Panacagrimonas sp. TaxID=2480088 RepID=UPI003B52C7B7
MTLRPLLTVLLSALAVALGILALICWREIVTFTLVAGAAWLVWRLKWLLLGALGLSWFLGGDGGDV